MGSEEGDFESDGESEIVGSAEGCLETDGRELIDGATEGCKLMDGATEGFSVGSGVMFNTMGDFVEGKAEREGFEEMDGVKDTLG